jgi:hypothetical protein
MTVTSTPRRTFSRRDVAVLQKESPPFRAREDVNERGTVNRGYTLVARARCSPCDLEEDPGAVLGLVDPVLDQAGGSDVAILVAKGV